MNSSGGVQAAMGKVLLSSDMPFNKRTLVELSHIASRALLGKQRAFIYRRARAWRDLKRLSRADVAFVSHAKAGRTWTRVMLSRLYQLKFGLADQDIIKRENFNRHNRQIPVFLFTMGNYISDVRPISDQASPFYSKKLIFLARHPADTAVSFYFHHRTRVKPHLRDIKRISEDLGDVQLFDFMQDRRFGLSAVVDYMNRWMDALRTHPRHLLLRYEDLRREPQRELMRIADFLGEEFTAEHYADAIEFASFDKLKEKETQNFFDRRRLQPRDPANPDSFKVRRGKVGGYRDYFTPEQIAWIDKHIASHLTPVLGYLDLPKAVAAERAREGAPAAVIRGQNRVPTGA